MRISRAAVALLSGRAKLSSFEWRLRLGLGGAKQTLFGGVCLCAEQTCFTASKSGSRGAAGCCGVSTTFASPEPGGASVVVAALREEGVFKVQ